MRMIDADKLLESMGEPKDYFEELVRNVVKGSAPIDVTSGEQYESNFCPNCGADMRGEKE